MFLRLSIIISFLGSTQLNYEIYKNSKQPLHSSEIRNGKLRNTKQIHIGIKYDSDRISTLIIIWPTTRTVSDVHCPYVLFSLVFLRAICCISIAAALIPRRIQTSSKQENPALKKQPEAVEGSVVEDKIYAPIYVAEHFDA